MDIFSILALFLSVFITSLLMLYIKLNQKALSGLLYFSGAFLLALAFTHIIPDIFHHEGTQNLGYFVLLGFLIQVVLEFFSGGADHGHSHSVDEHSSHHHKLNPVGLLIGIGLHAFFEGMPFSGHFHEHEHVGHLLLFGIIVHKIPIAIVLMSLFLGAGYSKKKSFIYLLIFALAAPLGSVVSYFAGHIVHDIEQYYQIIMAVVVGIFFHIATIILYEGEKGHKFNLLKFAIILAGIGVAYLAGH